MFCIFIVTDIQKKHLYVFRIYVLGAILKNNIYIPLTQQLHSQVYI